MIPLLVLAGMALIAFASQPALVADVQQDSAIFSHNVSVAIQEAQQNNVQNNVPRTAPTDLRSALSKYAPLSTAEKLCNSYAGSSVLSSTEISCKKTNVPIPCNNPLLSVAKNDCTSAGGTYSCDSQNISCKKVSSGGQLD